MQITYIGTRGMMTEMIVAPEFKVSWLEQECRDSHENVLRMLASWLEKAGYELPTEKSSIHSPVFPGGLPLRESQGDVGGTIRTLSWFLARIP